MSLGEQKLGICVGYLTGVLLLLVIVLPAVYLSNRDDDDDVNHYYEKPVDGYVGSMKASNVMNHLEALQDIATDNGGTRAVGTPGYKDSVDYIIQQLKDGGAKCDPQTQSFGIEMWSSLITPKFAQLDPFVDYGSDIQILQYSGSGNVTAPLASLPADNTGCTQDSWNGVDVNGKIALVIRGDCAFNEKSSSAFAAGAVGVIIYNDGTSSERQGSFGGTLGELQSGPVFSLSHSLGNQLSTSTAQFWMEAQTTEDTTETWNVLCEWNEGNANQTIVVGSHLDSVPAGPGINDNGSGSSMNLELALQLAKSDVVVQNKVIFAWWGAEEIGLKGSQYFVTIAKRYGYLADIQLNLNFDMIGSPNSRLEVYDGTKVTDLEIKEGCVAIQSIFEQYFDIADIPFVTVDKLNGERSDYAAFTTAEIPAGGLSTGSADIKPMGERTIFGGYANAAYDPCYHLDCDNTDNIDKTAVQANSEAAAYAVGTLASSPQLPSILNFASPSARRARMNEKEVEPKRVFSSV